EPSAAHPRPPDPSNPDRAEQHDDREGLVGAGGMCDHVRSAHVLVRRLRTSTQIATAIPMHPAITPMMATVLASSAALVAEAASAVAAVRRPASCSMRSDSSCAVGAFTGGNIASVGLVTSSKVFGPDDTVRSIFVPWTDPESWNVYGPACDGMNQAR